jgi:DNA adenine methylase
MKTAGIERRCRPFLRWPGGKRWLAPLLEPRISKLRVERYIEPFLGGGALFFYFGFADAILSDINSDLVNVYRQVKKDVAPLIAGLKCLAVDRETYEKVRLQREGGARQRAIRLLYLNRTSFSGIYRLNKNGEFNVPYGGGERSPEVLWRNNLLEQASRLLKNVRLACCDFEKVMKKAGKGDLIYCDPTYTVMHNSNGFRRYNERNFSWNDQVRLAAACHELAEKGACLVISNAFHRDIAALYQGFEWLQVQRYSRVCPNPEFRTQTREYLFLANL